MKILITGSSGFIGYHAAKKFLKHGHEVLGIDNENNYYDINLKISRRNKLLKFGSQFKFVNADLSNIETIQEFKLFKPELIINLAAQAGVRHSLDFPHDYTRSNIDSFLNILEYSKSATNLKHVVFASTSSVYGGNEGLPFKESHGVDHPLQYYAVTKRTNELMAHAYSNLYGLRCTGLRFFTVYGPWGRPDMALFLFTKNIIENKPIKIFNKGNHLRDFTYVDDIVNGIYFASMDYKFLAQKGFKFNDPSTSNQKFRILNIGRGKPEKLLDFIEEIERNLGLKAIKEFLPLQKGDVEASHADTTKLQELGYIPSISIAEGVKNFIEWYKNYYKID